MWLSCEAFISCTIELWHPKLIFVMKCCDHHTEQIFELLLQHFCWLRFLYSYCVSQHINDYIKMPYNKKWLNITEWTVHVLYRIMCSLHIKSLFAIEGPEGQLKAWHNIQNTKLFCKEIIFQSINHLFVLSGTETSKCTVQCRTGHKGMKHLQVPETKPNNKNTQKITW